MSPGRGGTYILKPSSSRLSLQPCAMSTTPFALPTSELSHYPNCEFDTSRPPVTRMEEPTTWVGYRRRRRSPGVQSAAAPTRSPHKKSLLPPSQGGCRQQSEDHQAGSGCGRAPGAEQEPRAAATLPVPLPPPRALISPSRRRPSRRIWPCPSVAPSPWARRAASPRRTTTRSWPAAARRPHRRPSRSRRRRSGEASCSRALRSGRRHGRPQVSAAGRLAGQAGAAHKGASS